jgi:hypothetical protein
MRGREELCRGLGGVQKTGYSVELIEEASLVEDYGRACSPYCAVLLT